MNTGQETSARLRQLTEKGLSSYEENVSEYHQKLQKLSEAVESVIDQFNFEDSEENQEIDNRQVRSNAYSKFDQYVELSNKFTNYLENVRTEHSVQELTSHREVKVNLKIKLDSFLSRIDSLVKFDSETVKSRKTRSEHTCDSAKSFKSSVSSLMIQQKAKSEKAKARLKFAEMQAELEKQKALLEEEETLNKAHSVRKKKNLEINLNLIAKQCDAAEAEAELNAICSGLSDQSEKGSTCKKSDVISEELRNRTNKYVEEQSRFLQDHYFKINEPDLNIYEPQCKENDVLSHRDLATYKISEPVICSNLNPKSAEFIPLENEPNFNQFPLLPSGHANEKFNDSRPYDLSLATELSKFLLKKELLMSRLTNFNDKPENYIVWKRSFQSIAKELNVNSLEEFDLLIKWLGPESKKYATSFRSSNVNDPVNGLVKLWNRLDERFGSPELIESILKEKLDCFPRVTNKDAKKMYELLDILSEIESIMVDEQYKSLLAYFNSSVGVNPILHKLPTFIQSKWIDYALKYKKQHNVLFPKFTTFVQFISDMSLRMNDPSFSFDSTMSFSSNKDKNFRFQHQNATTFSKVSSRKTEVSSIASLQVEQDIVMRCPIHNADHTLNDCRTFNKKSFAERKELIKTYGLCFKCCVHKHLARDCKENICCKLCSSKKHPTALHVHAEKVYSAPKSYGGEPSTKGNNDTVNSKCTQICGSNFGGKSCAKTVLVKVYPEGSPEQSLLVYAIIDDQSNRSLARSEFFDHFNEHTENFQYVLSSCAGEFAASGRKATGYIVESTDSSCKLQLPTITECNEIPNMREEIATPEVAMCYEHLNGIIDCIPKYNPTAEILLIIGRDLISAHHVLDHKIGPFDTPYAQKLPLGWVIIGETCLGKTHRPDKVNVNKTLVFRDGRNSFLSPCSNLFLLKDKLPRCDVNNDFKQCHVFCQTKNDAKIGLSIEDKEFLKQMDAGFSKNSNGKWSAPLPFKIYRPILHNNFDQALQRANALSTSLKNNEAKRNHFFEFMGKIFENGHAELAPPLKEDEECWYLPIFGVYHPKKPDKIRVVFDSSAKSKGISLNNVLMSGPDLTNNLLGVLLRFRRESVAITCDIEQMFFQFFVHNEHRNFLRFLWHKDNDPTQPLVEYRMCVHVFGNKPSPAVASYGLCKSACDHKETDLCTEVCDFVKNSFYVDDGLTSVPTPTAAIQLIKNVQQVLKENGGLRLHKILSNNLEVVNAFNESDLAKNLNEFSLLPESECLQRSLGLMWNIVSDNFTFQNSQQDKPFTRRGMLSTINSIFDPFGFVAPIVIGGKLILRKLISHGVDWDEPLSTENLSEWMKWIESTKCIDDVKISRTYVPVSFKDAVRTEIHIFSDASKDAIAAVSYVKVFDVNNVSHLGFVLGKAKVAPSHGHTIPRLELCAAVLAVEIYETISEYIGIPIDSTHFYTDSKVVLGYINNTTRRFYVYVSNRIDRIRRSSLPMQWCYVSSSCNPADLATRNISQDSTSINSQWLNAPMFLHENTDITSNQQFDLVNAHSDKEIKPQLNVLKTYIESSLTLGSARFSRFSAWKNLVRAITVLKHIAKCFHLTSSCKHRGWHTCSENKNITACESVENFIVKQVQYEIYSDEIALITANKPLPKNSSISNLSPYLDEDGVLRVGGRLSESHLEFQQKKPIIIPGKHHIANLLVRHFHERVQHQGRHFTEGAVRTAGYWIIGIKRLVSSILHKCVKCQKLRGKMQQQKMCDLPVDRLTPSPPFSYVGVDAFGPWSVLSRKTRGGQANSKRWAILFTCLVSRGVHIELVEEMSASSFINALRRFIALRGTVREFRSDRGTNFVGAANDLNIDMINVEDKQIGNFLGNNKSVWKFNSPHSSHMGGVWERMIGTARRILDSMLLDNSGKKLTHEVLSTFMAEVCSVINSRPLVAISSDPESPYVLSPNVLLTQKLEVDVQPLNIDPKIMYKSQWRHVQVLADQFWKRWRTEYLCTLQTRRKWQSECPDLKINDVVLLRDPEVARNDWPLAIVVDTFPDHDGKVRKVSVRTMKESKSVIYTRPITELVYLLSE